MFSSKLKELRAKKGLSQAELAKRLGVTQQAVGRWERDKNLPDNGVLKKISSLFGVSIDFLLDNHTYPKDGLPPLTPKDERQIARDLENMLDSLNGAAAMSDDPDDEEDREMLKAALLHAMTLSKRMAKKKFTPKKYRRED
ncbi:helix-turn-helix transcriptional regulator [uncultured Selenomonas sp.]|uniref:helix-turn-helix transcriptional regulator n=1 Tax=uncultured Selenomonas sp. TaxID=159275 RepID=UPI002675FEF5|nr:helix-turn-helix transcriptional regulator [uncultured Selenomonas sp.]